MKPRSAAFAAVLVVMASVVLVGMVYSVAGHFLSSSNSNTSCPTLGIKYFVHIENNTMLPSHTDAKQCDTLTITNDDEGLKLIAFGPHDHHITYDGVTEKLLSQGQSLTITLNQTGTFEVHDHLQDIAQGTFTVAK